MKYFLTAAVAAALAGPLAAQQVPQNCDMEFPNTPNTRATIRQMPGGVTNTFSGGGIVARCIGQGNLLTADSAEYYEAEGRLYLVGNVRYTEPRATVNARTMTYYQNADHLHAEGDVVAVMANGSTLRGPVADYYRSTPQRPVARLVAPGRPRITLVQKDTTGRGRPPDTAHVVANQIVMDGDSLVYASLRVEITRPDMIAKGDSAFLDSGNDFARLMGSPSVEGKGERPFTLTGGVIDLYSRSRQLERVVATPRGHALSQDLELVADTIDLRLEANQLQRAIAWGNTRARAISPEREIAADSIDAIMPGQRVREVRAVGEALATSAPDSGFVTTERDWLSGDTIVAHFDSVAAGDTAGRPQIREIVAQGSARSYYQMKNSSGPETQPTVNYVRGRIIEIDFENRRVATVTVTDQATGVLIEPAAASAPLPASGQPPPAAGQPPATTPPRPPAPARVPGARP
ncbi:MAG TPA: LptA/OstA family protein [Gemmatimonadaceae bacterium]|nr:LptA/OstA family protein [Gemmatimonadaceae bacterium]